MERSTKLIGSTLIMAITASLCCVTPVLALIAGTSGIASTFTWVEPFRPYLIGLTVLTLAFAWYQKLKPKSEIDCECDPEDATPQVVRKPKFINSKSFLTVITIFAIVMLAFPYYSGIFYSDSDKQIMVVKEADFKKVEFKISGMTCASCEIHVNHEVSKLDGIVNSEASYENANAIIEFDQTKTSESQIEEAISNTGYKVISIK